MTPPSHAWRRILVQQTTPQLYTFEPDTKIFAMLQAAFSVVVNYAVHGK